MMKMEAPKCSELRGLTADERHTLEYNGCRSLSWHKVLVSPLTNLALITDTRFVGDVVIGNHDLTVRPRCGISRATIEGCVIGDNVEIRNVGGLLRGYNIGDGASIIDAGTIECDRGTTFGVGTKVSVLDETGSRPVTIYPGLSAQIAEMAARMPDWSAETLAPLLEQAMKERMPQAEIGRNSKVLGIKIMRNVSVGHDITITGASYLENGSIINNSRAGAGLAFIGPDVKARNFIIEDGSADNGTIIENVYIGQGARLDHAFTAHDSLFFANSTLENGEACAILAGPFTTSMHKATLLIGCITQFMNAGSASNQSNHLYKMGPIHWGIMQRGVKMASGSYAMWGAKIGAFTMLSGYHKMHPDSSQFPFSYLFGDEKAGTILVPGIMLRNSGLIRDEKKWSSRERRDTSGTPLFDRINFEIFNPATVGAMSKAISLIDHLRRHPVDDDRFVRYKGLKLRVSNLERGRYFYSLGIYKYLSRRFAGEELPVPVEEGEAEDWIDLSGQLVRRSTMERVKKASSLQEMEEILSKEFRNFRSNERDWIASALQPWLKKGKVLIDAYAGEFDRLVEEDRESYMDLLQTEARMLQL